MVFERADAATDSYLGEEINGRAQESWLGHGSYRMLQNGVPTMSPTVVFAPESPVVDAPTVPTANMPTADMPVVPTAAAPPSPGSPTNNEPTPAPKKPAEPYPLTDEDKSAAVVLVPIVVLILLFFLYRCYRNCQRKREQHLLNLRSAQADSVLGDMQMIPSEDPDAELL